MASSRKPGLINEQYLLEAHPWEGYYVSAVTALKQGLVLATPFSCTKYCLPVSALSL